MKRYFVTGLIILLPVAFTLAIVFFLFNFLTEPFVGMVKSIFSHFNLFQTGFLFWSADQIQKYFSQLLILALLFFFTVGLGILARWFLFHYLLSIWEIILLRIPVIGSIYTTCQDVIQTLFTRGSNSFKQVVMVPFPSANTLVIGLVTKDNLPPIGENDSPLIAIFVPTTPNPTSGFLMMYRKEDVTYLDMKVEDALKYVISCGMISTPLNAISSEQAQLKFKNGWNVDG